MMATHSGKHKISIESLNDLQMKCWILQGSGLSAIYTRYCRQRTSPAALSHDVLGPPSPVGRHRGMICGTGGVMAMPKWSLECNLTQISDTSSLYNHSILWNKNTFNALLITGFYWYIRCDCSEAGILPNWCILVWKGWYHDWMVINVIWFDCHSPLFMLHIQNSSVTFMTSKTPVMVHLHMNSFLCLCVKCNIWYKINQIL